MIGNFIDISNANNTSTKLTKIYEQMSLDKKRELERLKNQKNGICNCWFMQKMFFFDCWGIEFELMLDEKDLDEKIINLQNKMCELGVKEIELKMCDFVHYSNYKPHEFKTLLMHCGIIV